MVFCRQAAVYLLISVTVLCPYLCWDGVTAAPGTAVVVMYDAGNASHHSPFDRDSDENRGNDSGCHHHIGECLCRGAIVQLHITIPGRDEGLTVFMPVDIRLPTIGSAIVNDGLFSVAHAVCPFPSVDSGREVRALIESLLL